MKITEIPVLKSCMIYRISYSRRPTTAVPGRNFASLSFRTSGTTRIRGEDCDLTSGPNSLTYVPAGYPYRTDFSEEGEMIVMHFFAEESCGGLPATVPVEFPKATYNLFETAARRYTAKGCDLVLMSMAYQILAEASSIFCPKQPIPPRMKRCKQYMDENITDPLLRIRDLAAMCETSEVWFRREFEKYYGATPLEYIKKKRIETAKLLLQTGLYTVTEVAFRAGFESSSYFSAEFRRMEGMSPSKFEAKQG